MSKDGCVKNNHVQVSGLYARIFANEYANFTYLEDKLSPSSLKDFFQ